MNHFRYIGKCECSCNPWSFGCGKKVVEKIWRDIIEFKVRISKQMRFHVER